MNAAHLPASQTRGCIVPKLAGFLIVAWIAALSAPAQAAEYQFSIYGGYQTAPSSRVTGRDDTGAPFSFNSTWKPAPFDFPPYYGVRATRWGDSGQWGVALEFTHEMAIATKRTLSKSGFTRLEFSHGLNILTVNAMRRFPSDSRLTPYFGVGIGVTIPHVEVRTRAGGPGTHSFQYGGPAARLLAGVEYRLNERWAVFTEVNSTFSSVDVRLNGGGRLRSDINTNAINVGISYRF